MKILMLTKYPMRGPSSRYRFFQFLPELYQRNHSVTILPFFTDSWLEKLFDEGKTGPFYLPNRFLARLGHCLTGKRHDLVWIEGELMPYLPAGIEKILHPLLPKRRIYEFDDANWLRYENKPFLDRKFGRILKGAAGIVTGNPFLEAYVRGFNPRTIVVPTVVDWARYATAQPERTGMTIGWIGSQNTGFFLKEIFPVLEKLAQDYPLKLKVVGARVANENLNIEQVEWSEETEVEQIESFDIGIMPLTQTPWAEGKCGLKLIQYLAAGVPAVASAVGVNRAYLEHSGGGYPAINEAEWLFGLRKLLDNPELRKEMGARGRTWVQTQMTVQAQAPRLIDFLENAG